MKSVSAPGLIVYFYFDFREDSKTHAENMLRSLIHQTVPITTGGVQKLEAFKADCPAPSLDDFLKFFEKILDVSGPVLAVLDGLDECNDCDNLERVFKAILEYGNRNSDIMTGVI